MASKWVVQAVFLLFFLAEFPSELESTKLPERVDLCIVTAFKGKYNGKSSYTALLIARIVAEKMSVSPSTTKIAMITSAGKPRVQFGLNKCVNRECVLANLRKIGQRRLYRVSRTARIGQALYLASKVFERESRLDTKKYVLLITDSSTVMTREFGEISKRLRQQGVTTYVIMLKAVTDYNVYEGLQMLTGGKANKQSVIVASRDDLNPAVDALPFVTVSYSNCYGNKPVYDECERRCNCRNGKLTKCTRIRKEFTEMSIKERLRYINAFKTLASNPTYKTKYENFVRIHKDLFFKGIHNGEHFLPWHRWYILAFENMLRDVDCRITVPYWDWAFWSNAAWQKNIHIWNNEDYGLGGNGDPERGYCVQDGPFREGVFKTPSFDDPEEVLNSIKAVHEDNAVPYKSNTRSRCLRRSFHGKPVGIPEIRRLLTNRAASFWRFEKAVRLLLHNSMHNEIGGHMCSEYASVAPEFFLHHAFLDKVWYTWQQHSTACMKARFSHLTRKMTKFRCPDSQKDLLDSSKLPGHISVTYTDYYYAARKAHSYGTAKGKLRSSGPSMILNNWIIYREEDSNDNEASNDDNEAGNDSETNDDLQADDESSDQFRNADSYSTTEGDSTMDEETQSNVEKRTWPPYGRYSVASFI